MANLIVSTLTDVNSIVIFVANAEGVPETGLGPENFKLQPAARDAAAAMLIVERVSVAPLPGFYALDLATVDSQVRCPGLYIFDLVVEKGEDRGRSLSSTIIS